MNVLSTSLAVAPGASLAVLVAALFGAAIAVDRALVVARSRLSGQGRPFIERLVGLVQAGEIDQALAACSNTQAILPDIGLIVLRTRLREPADLQALAAAAVASTTPRLVRRLRYLPAAAAFAILAGAGGTAASLSQGTAGAAAESLAPLALSLFVAAALTVLHGFLANQVDAILAQVTEFSHRLVNVLLDRPDVRLGHR